MGTVGVQSTLTWQLFVEVAQNHHASLVNSTFRHVTRAEKLKEYIAKRNVNVKM